MSRRKGLLAAALTVAAIAVAASATALWIRLSQQLVEILGRPSARAQVQSSTEIGGPFTLVDDTGAQVTATALRGKPTVMYFGYTFCPEACPTTLTDLTQWMQILGPDADRLNYVFVTLDPERDTPKVMHDYVSAFDPRIRGFTGTSDQIAKVASEYRVYYKRISTSDGGYVMDHTSILYMMDADGKYVGLIGYQEKTTSAVAKLKKLALASLLSVRSIRAITAWSFSRL
jgi:protein SCO1/2